MLHKILSRLKPGGTGIFQVLTKLRDYSFDAAAYLASPTSGDVLEMHALPFDVVVATVEQAGCKLVLASEYDCVDHAGSESIEFLIRKSGSPGRDPLH